MKNFFFRKLNWRAALLFVTMTLVNLGAYSQTFIYDGIKYSVIDSENKNVSAVEFDFQDNTPLSYEFPSSVVDPDGETYTVTVFGEAAFFQFPATTVIIPETIQIIGEWCFALSNIEKIVFKENSQISLIDEYAFMECVFLENIDFPDSVSILGDASFSFCESLKSVYLPKNIAFMGTGVFSFCPSLKEADIDISGIVGSGTFYECENLKEVTLGENVVGIDSICFWGSGIENLFLPSALTEILPNALSGAMNLKNIEVENGNPVYISEDNIIYDVALTTMIFAVPSKTSFSIPSSVTTLGNGCTFGNLYIEDFIVPEGITRIEELALAGWNNLKNITLPETLEFIGNAALSQNPWIESVEFPASLKEIEFTPFGECERLMSVTIPETNEYFTSYNGDIYSKDMKVLILIASGKENVVVPDGVEVLFENAMISSTNLINVELPASLKEVGPYSFYQSNKLSDIRIPDAVESIGNRAFLGCYSLTDVELGAGLKEIDDLAFYDLPLNRVICKAEVPPMTGEDVFLYSTDNATLFVPENSLSLYASTWPWNDFSIASIDSASVDSLVSEGFEINIVNGDILIEGDINNGVVTVYDISGKIVYRGATNKVQGLAKGLYIISIQGKSFKIRI